MKANLNRKSNGAFTLVEIIGVMAIIGILGAVVAPRVIDGIREGRVTQLAQNLGQWKSGTDRYVQKQQRLPIDGQSTAVTQEGNAYTDPRTGSGVAAGQTSFGDWLLAQGLVSSITVPFGETAGARATLTSTPLVASNTITTIPISGFAQIRCAEETATGADTFTATQTRDVPHRVVFLAIPKVPLQEAAAIKSKIDGPFTGSNNVAVSDKDLLTSAAAQANNASVPASQLEALVRGNCRVGTGTNGVYNLYLYISND
jgi:type II secretory pathway pseudopilin PulG